MRHGGNEIALQPRHLQFAFHRTRRDVATHHEERKNKEQHRRVNPAALIGPREESRLIHGRGFHDPRQVLIG